MKASILRASRLFLLAALAAGCFPPYAGHDYYEEGSCDWEPDLIVDGFSFSTYEAAGTVLDFEEITLCNIGGATSDAGYRYQILLSQTPDWSDTAWGVFESAPMVGVASWDCVSVDPIAPVGDGPPEGYYYVIVSVDPLDSVVECDEDNNWTRSDDAVYVVPEGAE